MTRTIDRAERLSADWQKLRAAGPFTRAYHAARLTDGEIARAALQDYKPALPLTFEGAVFAGVGFLLGTTLLGTFLSAFRSLFRRRTPA